MQNWTGNPMVIMKFHKFEYFGLKTLKFYFTKRFARGRALSFMPGGSRERSFAGVFFFYKALY